MRRIIAGLTTALLALGLSVAAFAAPAIAHTPTVSGVAACQTDGSYTVTWTYTTTNVPDGKQAKAWVSSHTPKDSTLGGKGTATYEGKFFIALWAEFAEQYPDVTVVVANGSTTFTQTGIAAGESTASVTVETKWNDDFVQQASGTVTLDPSCGDTEPPACIPADEASLSVAATDETSRKGGHAPVPCEEPEVPAVHVSATASATAQSCVDGDASKPVSGYLTLEPNDNVSYQVNLEESPSGVIEAIPGYYYVTAIAHDGYVLDGPGEWELDIAASECTWPEEPEEPTEPEIPVDPETPVEPEIPVDPPVLEPDPEPCVENSEIPSGSWFINLVLIDNVDFFIDGVLTESAANEVEPGTYIVTAVARPGYELVGETEFVVVVGTLECEPAEPEIPTVPPVTPEEPEEPEEPPVTPEEPTEPVVPPVTPEEPVTPPVVPVSRTAVASASSESCASTNVVQGAITVAFPTGEETSVRYDVATTNTVEIPVELTAARTVMAPGNYTVTASTRSASETLAGTRSWNLVVDDADCAATAAVPVLALTGVATESTLTLAGGLMLLGAAGIYLRRRFVGVAK